MAEYPKFELRKNEGVSMLTKEIDEFGDEIVTRHHLSKATAERIFSELQNALTKQR